jgi:hypothetical protein
MKGEHCSYTHFVHLKISDIIAVLPCSAHTAHLKKCICSAFDSQFPLYTWLKETKNNHATAQILDASRFPLPD